MKNLPNNVVPVHLDSIGEISRTRWIGGFQVKCILSHADRFAKARLFASLMPTNAALVEEEDKLKAEVLSQLHVRVLSGPDWWTSTYGGQMMTDLDPLVDLLRLCQEATENWNKQLEEMASFGDGNAVVPGTTKS